MFLLIFLVIALGLCHASIVSKSEGSDDNSELSQARNCLNQIHSLTFSASKICESSDCLKMLDKWGVCGGYPSGDILEDYTEEEGAPRRKEESKLKTIFKKLKYYFLDKYEPAPKVLVSKEIETSDRSYWIKNFYGNARWAKTKFTLPYAPLGDFVYIQFWFIGDDCKTTELGLRKRRGRSYYSPLVFSTDDCHKTGYFKDKFHTFDTNSSLTRAEKRYIENDFETSKIRKNPGSSVTMTVSNESGSVTLWVDSEFVASIHTPFKIVATKFGTETVKGVSSIVLPDLDMDYTLHPDNGSSEMEYIDSLYFNSQ
ncbi:TPA_asm: P5 [Alnus trirhavirus 1]|nr:TPA_asm: P5 [Alnus trirhavirus 1]